MNKSVNESHAMWTYDPLQSERRFLAAINELALGRFELLRIQGGELVLDPWPTSVRYVKLGLKSTASRKAFSGEFELECPAIELFEQGEILLLEVRHSRPFSMDIEHRSIPARTHT